MDGSGGDYVVHGEAGSWRVRDANTRREALRESGAREAVQGALDLAGEAGGGRVLLATGWYPLSGPLRVPSRVTLAGRGHATQLAAAQGFTGDAAVLLEGARGAAVRDLAISGFGAGVLPNGLVLRESPQCVVDAVAVGGCAGTGIVVADNSFLTRVLDCIAAGNRVSGICIRDCFEGYYGNYVPVAAQNCLVYGGGKGIECDRAIVVNLNGCLVYQTAGYAFHLYRGSNSVLVSGCRTFQIGTDAYVSEESNEINVSGNIFCWHEGVGIRIENACWGTISGNNIIDNGSYNPNVPHRSKTFAEVGDRATPREAIILRNSRGMVVSGNALFNWHVVPPMAHAIVEDQACADNTLVGNNINYVDGAPVVSRGRGTTVAGNTVAAELPHIHHYGKQVLRGPTEQTIQSFEPHLTEQLIREIFGPGAQAGPPRQA